VRNIRTDLALEARELYQEENRQSIPGVEVSNEHKEGILITRVKITNSEGEAKMGKPIGNYITLEAPGIKDRDPEFEENVSQEMASELKKIISLDKDSKVLVVGLGNWNITPDALGPKVVERVMVTRHLLELIPEQVDERVNSVCAMAPGVLGITGIETGEIIKGIVERIKPDLIIAIDALAARRADRIGTTIQIADTGINPGSGIGNKRMGLNEETLGIKTIAIGVPTVVYAHTIGRDALQMLVDEFANQATPGSQFYKMIQQMNEQQMDALVQQVLTQGLGDLVVTPKEVDILIDHAASIISDGLNLALHDDISLEESRRFLH